MDLVHFLMSQLKTDDYLKTKSHRESPVVSRRIVYSIIIGLMAMTFGLKGKMSVLNYRNQPYPTHCKKHKSSGSKH